MDSLLKLKEILKDYLPSGQKMEYYVPKSWNHFHHQAVKKVDSSLVVNPYAFYADAIEYILDNQHQRNMQLNEAYVYSTMIRTSTSFDHDQSGKLEMKDRFGMKETGTFVKMIAYLPTLKKIGIDTIYMLPIMQTSKYEKKGELGSVYGVVDFFKIENDLFDPITKDRMSIDEQFAAFVQAAHIFGMNVVLDIIPRTNSVNTQFVIDHPEWFYWIDTSNIHKYHSPHVPGVGSIVPVHQDNIEKVYMSKDVQEHIQLFRFAPNILFPDKWEEFVKEFKAQPTDEILPLIEERFQMRIAPAFSDVINDVQPPWSDVTYFRMYLDNPKILKDKGITTPEAPYMLFDTIKSNLFPGDVENKELWETITSVLPYYIEKFDIDGARIDMGHALPQKLNRLIMDEARNKKREFYFIAEILNTDKQAIKQAKEMGYDLVIGDGFYHTHRFEEEKTRDFYYKASTLPLLVFAAGETHDNPRLISRAGDFKTLQFVSIMNLFAHNCVPFLNSGQEFLEKQPMNLGVDCPPQSDEALSETSHYYKKLALFDYYQFHYDNDHIPFLNTLSQVYEIRKKYIKQIVDKNKVTYLYYPDTAKMGFVYESNESRLYVLVNASLHQSISYDIEFDEHRTLFTTSGEDLTLEPLDIRIIEERK